MAHSVADKLANVEPRMLRSPAKAAPQDMGEQYQSECGQAFEWALDRARITKQEAAFRMGYSDSGVLGRWCSGTENVVLKRARMIGDEFWAEFVIALAQLCAGVDVRTQITLAKVR